MPSKRFQKGLLQKMIEKKWAAATEANYPDVKFDNVEEVRLHVPEGYVPQFEFKVVNSHKQNHPLFKPRPRKTEVVAEQHTSNDSVKNPFA